MAKTQDRKVAVDEAMAALKRVLRVLEWIGGPDAILDDPDEVRREARRGASELREALKELEEAR